jgi:hypothetical protein
MERTKIDEAGRDGAANAPESYGDDVDARLVGEVIAEIVTSLGPNHAIMPSNLVRITPAVSGRLPGRSGCDPSEQLRGWLIPRSHGYAAASRRGAGT